MQSWVDASSYPHGGGEELLGDMEALNITNMRPDIHEVSRSHDLSDILVSSVCVCAWVCACMCVCVWVAWVCVCVYSLPFPDLRQWGLLPG